MTTQQKQSNLIKHVEKLCNELNENGIFTKIKMGDAPNYYYEDYNWSVDISHPEATFLGGICNNNKAFHFLKNKGLIDIGVCWDCGDEPIQFKNTFTDGYDSSIQYFICDNCYKNKVGFQKMVRGEKSSNCYIATVCYGDIDAFEVKQLRKFRDDVLLKSNSGKYFVKIYYKIAPCIAKRLYGKHYLNGIIRKLFLDKIVRKINKRGL